MSTCSDADRHHVKSVTTCVRSSASFDSRSKKTPTDDDERGADHRVAR